MGGRHQDFRDTQVEHGQKRLGITALDLSQVFLISFFYLWWFFSLIPSSYGPFYLCHKLPISRCLLGCHGFLLQGHCAMSASQLWQHTSWLISAFPKYYCSYGYNFLPSSSQKNLGAYSRREGHRLEKQKGNNAPLLNFTQAPKI